MKAIRTVLSAAILSCGIGFTAQSAATTTDLAADVNVVFLVDESGSMSGEQAFIGNFVTTMASDLLAITGLSSSYGLVGFGGSSSHLPGHTHAVNGVTLGTAAQLSTATSTLQTSGGTEDGYEAIEYAIDNITFTPNSRVAFVLVTDEDRDVTKTLSYSTMLSMLSANGITLTGIVSQGITDGSSTTAVGTDGTVTYIADGSGGFTQGAGVVFTSASGTTKADYTDLALASGGCVADLNQLRAGGNTANSFAGAFTNCLTIAIRDSGSSAGLAATVGRLPLVSVHMVNRRAGIAIGRNVFGRLGVRRLAGNSPAPTAFQTALLAQQSAEKGLSGGGASADRFAFNLRKAEFFIAGHYDEGDVDTTTTSVATSYDTRAFSSGVDYQFRDDFIGGVALGVIDGNSRNDDGSGSFDTSGMSLSLYGTYFNEKGIHVDGMFSYLNLEHDSTRLSGANTVMANFDSRQLSVMVQAGWDRPIPNGNGLIATPFVNLSYVNSKVDSYNESGVGALAVGKDTSNSLTSELGVALSKMISRSSGSFNLIGEAAFVHEFNDDGRSVSVSTVGSTTTFTTPVQGLDNDYFRVGLGVTTKLKSNTSLDISYNRLFAHSDLSNQSLDAKVKLAFK